MRTPRRSTSASVPRRWLTRASGHEDVQAGNVPKRARARVEVGPVVPLSDPLRVLGHPARGRRRR